MRWHRNGNGRNDISDTFAYACLNSIGRRGSRKVNCNIVLNFLDREITLHFQGSLVFFTWSGKKTFFFLVRPLPGCPNRLFSYDSTTISFAAVLDHLNKMTGAKYDGEGDDGDANGEDGDE